MAEKVGLKDIPPIASSEDLSDESPLRDYIAPQAPRIDISLTNSLQRDSCDSDFGLGLESGLNEDSIMSDDLKSSNEELTYIDPRELQMRKKSHSNTMNNKEDESETIRKASSCSDCGLLTITGAGRDSRISSTASLISVASNASHLSSTSNASRLSATSNASRLSVTSDASRLSATSNLSKASRGSSPHRILLETSFCGPLSPMNETKNFVQGAVEKKFVKSEEIIVERKITSDFKAESIDEDITKPNSRIKPQLDNPKMQKYIPLKYSLDRDEESLQDARKVDIDVRGKSKGNSSRPTNKAHLEDNKTQKFIPLKYSLDENGEKKSSLLNQSHQKEKLECTKSDKELLTKNPSTMRSDSNYDQDAKNLSIDPRTQKFIPLKYSLDKGDENHRTTIPNLNPKPPRKFIRGIAQDIRSENKHMENTLISENKNVKGQVETRDDITRESGITSVEGSIISNITTLSPKVDNPITTSTEKDEYVVQKTNQNLIPSVKIEAPDIDPRTQKFIPLKYSIEREDSRDYCKTATSSSANKFKKGHDSQIHKPASESANLQQDRSKFVPAQRSSDDIRGGVTTQKRPSVSKDQRFVPLQYSVDSAGNSKTSSPKTNPNSPRRLKPFTNRTILNFLAKYDKETDSLRPAAIPSSPIKDEFVKFMTLPDYDDPSSGSIRRTKSMSHTERKSVSKSREEQPTEIVKAFSANAGLNEIPSKKETDAISVKVHIHESPTKGNSCGEIYGNSLSVNESTMGERSYSNDEGRMCKPQQQPQTRTVRSMSHLGATETEKMTPSFLEIGSDAIYRRCSESARNISGESSMSKSRSGSIKSLFTSIFRRSSSVKSQKQPKRKSATGVITVNRASPRSEFPPTKGRNSEPDQIFIPLHSPDEKSSNRESNAEGNPSSKLPSDITDETQAQYNSVLAEFQKKNLKTNSEDSDGNSYCEGVTVPVQQVNVVIHHLSRPQTPEQIVIQEQHLDNMEMPNQSQIEAHLEKVKSEATVKRAQSDDNNNRLEMSGNESTRESVDSDGGGTVKSVKSLVEKFESTSSSSSIERKQRKMKREVRIEYHPEDRSTRTEITESSEILESLVINESPTGVPEHYEELPYLPTTLPLERSVAVPMLSVRERQCATCSVVTCQRKRPRSSSSTTLLDPAKLDDFVNCSRGNVTDDVRSEDGCAESGKIQIKLPITIDDFPRNRTRKLSWKDFAEEGLQSPRKRRPKSVNSFRRQKINEFKRSHAGMRSKSHDYLSSEFPKFNQDFSYFENDTSNLDKNDVGVIIKDESIRSTGSWVSFDAGIECESRQSPRRITTLPSCSIDPDTHPIHELSKRSSSLSKHFESSLEIICACECHES